MPAELVSTDFKMSGRAWLDDDGQMLVEAQKGQRYVSITVFEPAEAHLWDTSDEPPGEHPLTFVFEEDGQETRTEQDLDRLAWTPQEWGWESWMLWDLESEDFRTLSISIYESEPPEPVLTYSCTWPGQGLCQTWDMTATQARNEGLRGSCNGDFQEAMCSQDPPSYGACLADGFDVVFYETLCSAGDDPFEDMTEMCASEFAGEWIRPEADCPQG